MVLAFLSLLRVTEIHRLKAEKNKHFDAAAPI